MNIELRNPNAPASDLELKRLEKEIGGTVPSDFSDFLSKRNGCAVEPNLSSRNDNVGVRSFLGVDRILAAKTVLADRLARTTWPVAEAEGGNYVCLRREPSGNWGVAFWDHELDEEIVLEPTFTEFLESLDKPEPSSLE
jgi:hypothetical protein